MTSSIRTFPGINLAMNLLFGPKAKTFKLRVIDASTITCGPFTWTRRDDARESWDCSRPSEEYAVGYFHVIRYTATPEAYSGFTGWRVGSGGPFTSAGGWTNLHDAIEGATPWLIKHYQENAYERVKAAQRITAGLAKLA